MKLNVTGVCAGPRNERCWRAIVDAAENWNSDLPCLTLEARFTNEHDVLLLELSAPGRRTETATIDISWIAYADQAERLEILTTKALCEMELGMREQLECQSWAQPQIRSEADPVR